MILKDKYGVRYMDSLKRDLRERYLSTYRECKKFGYAPTRFLDMVVSDDDIVAATRKLIYKEGGTSGFETLYMNKRLDLAVEKIILEPRFRVLFSKEDLDTAYSRLEEYKYDGLSQIERPE